MVVDPPGLTVLSAIDSLTEKSPAARESDAPEPDTRIAAAARLTTATTHRSVRRDPIQKHI
jgi:hypothetical protein